jgi:TrmH family RNA methyltransferase
MYNTRMPETITSHANPLVKQIRALRQPRQRRESGLFLVEGIHHVGEAVEAGWELELVAYAPDLLTSEYARTLTATLEERGVRLAAVAGSLFPELTDKENPQGVLALVRQRHLRLDELDPARDRYCVACVSPQDPGNVGAILRSMDAAGAQALFLLEGGTDPYHPTCVRASMGTLFWKPVVQCSFEAFLGWAKAGGQTLIGSSAHASLDYRQAAAFPQPFVLLLGSEQKGLQPEHLAACDRVVSLPMRGRASSLNLAVAAGILLYALMER